MVEKSSFSESRISRYFACCEANPNANAMKITTSVAQFVLYRMEFEPSSWDLWSPNCGSRTEIVQKFTFSIGGSTCGVWISLKEHFEIEIFGVSTFFGMLYRSGILRKESEIRQVPGMVGAVVDPLLGCYEYELVNLNFQMASSSAEKNSALRFTDIGTLTKEMVAPIEGYGKMPVVSLDEAIKPLLGIVPKVERSVFLAKQRCEEPEDGLTSDESASIMLYTFESKPHEHSLYVILNATLRSPEREELLEPWLLYLRLVLTALTRLPPEHRFVNRGVREDLRKQYPIGKTIVWWGFSSCTTSIGVLESEHFFGKTGTRTLFQIDCYSGKDVKKHSSVQREDEVLLLPARQFIVTSCLDSGNGVHIIQLKEMEPKFPLLEPVPLPTLPLPKPTSSIQPMIATNLSG
jgi:hypothetical protein